MEVEIACSTSSRLRGLLGREEFSGALLLTPCNDVHTFGMRRAIDIAFIEPDGTVLEAHRGVGPCRRVRCRTAVATIERFAAETPWFDRGDRVELKDYVHENRRRNR